MKTMTERQTMPRVEGAWPNQRLQGTACQRGCATLPTADAAPEPGESISFVRRPRSPCLLCLQT